MLKIYKRADVLRLRERIEELEELRRKDNEKLDELADIIDKLRYENQHYKQELFKVYVSGDEPAINFCPTCPNRRVEPVEED